ncbi:hypothetical protein RJ640_019940 [Escallonia rubra]|uniref:Large ribosomal subunit protein uL15/eL18 domain-containing protein n=1 Tax=Escallonia rubra TaxID=112253 RepID=A0AA88QSB5_9ASTE|nr:hypothetical protein RJ640_019940 [Escallonia rubra]
MERLICQMNWELSMRSGTNWATLTYWQRLVNANGVLLRGPKNSREAARHFGKAPGVPHSHTKPNRQGSWKIASGDSTVENGSTFL